VLRACGDEEGDAVTDTPITRATPADSAAILSLLERAGLPTVGLLEHLASTFVARRGEKIVGTVALELYSEGALLRSVAVDQNERGTGLGKRLSECALAHARMAGVPEVYLLTTTAEDFFPKFGFERIDRADVPAAVQRSVEFTSACPASAVVMRKAL
jgi:amino-acid N-acetyltransferase